jgi:hypothetical protein
MKQTGLSMLLLDGTQVAVFWMMEESRAGVLDTSVVADLSAEFPQVFFLQILDQDGPPWK